MLPPIAAATRWAAVSASANAEADYRAVLDDAATAYESICICPPAVAQTGKNNEVDVTEPGCDGGVTCVCQKPASAPFDHPWIVSRAGYRKFLAQHLHSCPRNPEVFEMYTFNDHYGYGQLEMMQNLLLDFVGMEALWREQWTIVEGAVLWLLDDESTAMLGIGTAHDVVAIFNLIGRMFLTALARLERESLLHEVPSLGAVMSMYIELTTRLHRFDVLQKERKIRGAFDYDVRRLGNYVLAYSRKHAIALPGHADVGLYQEKRRPPELPTPTTGSNDPWGFAKAFAKYRAAHSRGMAFHYCGFEGIGGDALDITTWTSKKRAAKSLEKKDPLGKDDIDAIKRGWVLQCA